LHGRIIKNVSRVRKKTFPKKSMFITGANWPLWQ
jgi:hypothetical protein